MSTLIIDEMYPGVEFAQTVKIFRDTNLAHVRPWIYLEGTLADGDFQLEVLQGANVLATSTINYVDINDAKTETYAHGFIRFDFDSLSLLVSEGNTDEEYIFRFSMINHTKDTSNYLAIARNWDIKIYPTYGDVIAQSNLLLWTSSEGNRDGISGRRVCRTSRLFTAQ